MSGYLFAYQLATHNDIAELCYLLAAIAIFIGSMFYVAFKGDGPEGKQLGRVKTFGDGFYFLVVESGGRCLAVIFSLIGPLIILNMLAGLFLFALM